MKAQNQVSTALQTPSMFKKYCSRDSYIESQRGEKKKEKGNILVFIQMQIESQRSCWRTGSCQLHLRNRAFCTVVVKASIWLWGTAPKQFSLTCTPQGMGEVSHPWSQMWAGGVVLGTNPSGVTWSGATSLSSRPFGCVSLCYGEFSFLFQSSYTSSSSFLTRASDGHSPLSFSPTEALPTPHRNEAAPQLVPTL